MKNINKLLILLTIFLFFFYLLFTYQYNKYKLNYNNKLNGIITLLLEKNENLTKDEIIDILNNNKEYKDILKEYGLYKDIDSFIIENDKNFNSFITTDICFIILLILILIFIIYKDRLIFNKKINELTKYFNEINKGNYDILLQDNEEGNLSILKNEIYKMTIMLKEQTEKSKKDKENLKTSLEDISHQLKTPLTSITILLDNIVDNPNMDENTKIEFISDIRKEIFNINFLVQNLLKLSKFDANTIIFNEEEAFIKDIINEAIKKISTLCDLKNININVNGNTKAKIKCDFNWQIEAISNILKNSLEYSKENDNIYIDYDTNNVYTFINIKDNGIGIDKKDLPHIFKRFYKAKNQNKDSVGIGLSLSKKIIEKDNGKISVYSKLNEGTTFKIKYFN